MSSTADIADRPPRILIVDDERHNRQLTLITELLGEPSIVYISTGGSLIRKTLEL
jgi:hypothetical protein